MKNDKLLDQLLDTALPRLEALWQRATTMNEDREVLVWETLEQLTDALQEMQVAVEELHHRTEEMEAVNQSLKAESRRYQELFEFAPTADLVTDLNAMIQEANQAAASLLNVPRKSYLVGKPLFVFVAEDVRRDFRIQLSQLQTSKEVKSWEVQLQPWQGKSVPTVCTVAVVRSEGEAVGLRWMLEDMTERLQVEERYALAVRSANDGVWDWDLQTNTVYLSPRWKAMLGYKENEIGTAVEEWLNLVHPKDRKCVQALIASHLAGQTPHFQSEHRMLHWDRTYRWILCRGMAVRDANGKAYRMAGLQTDITYGKLAEERLLHQELCDVIDGVA